MRRSETWPVRPTGVTLIELMVVITILGLVVGMTGLAFTSLRAQRGSAPIRAAQAARAQAIREGRPIAYPTARRPVRPTALFLPDGRGVGLGVDPLTGEPIDATN